MGLQAGLQNAFSFTKTAIAALPAPESGRAVYRDTKATGLQVRVTPSGAKTFSVYRRPKGGQPERITLGAFPSLTVEQARRLAADINAAVENGENPAKVKRAHKAEPTFGEVFERFIEGKRSRAGKPLAAATILDYRLCLKNHMGKIRNLKLSQIARDDVRRMHVTASKVSIFSANRAAAITSAVFRYAIDDLEVFSGQNPAERFKKTFERPRERFAGAAELPALISAMRTDPDGDFFFLALLTGARRSNVQAMRWDEVNLTERVWRIPTTKNGEPQTVTLAPEAVAVLRARMASAAGEFVFPSASKTGHLVSPKRAWARILERAGIDDLRIHDLRRTLGSWQAKTGASLSIIGKSLNHKTHQSTAIYARLDMDPVRQSVDTATAAMMAAAGEVSP